MTGLSRETRLQIMLDQDELAAIDDYRFEHRIPSRAAAVRQLLRLGLQAIGSEQKNNRRSSEYGVLGNRDADDGSAGG
jgi:metal-responsive CopG/Arc/MetJ family transcriptional regulator